MTDVQCELAVEALVGLFDEFRHGNIVALSAEEKGMQRHAGPLSARWNNRFHGFPTNHFPFTSFRGEFYRKHRDAHLKEWIGPAAMFAAPGGSGGGRPSGRAASTVRLTPDGPFTSLNWWGRSSVRTATILGWRPIRQRPAKATWRLAVAVRVPGRA